MSYTHSLPNNRLEGMSLSTNNDSLDLKKCDEKNDPLRMERGDGAQKWSDNKSTRRRPYSHKKTQSTKRGGIEVEIRHLESALSDHHRSHFLSSSWSEHREIA